MFEKALEYLGDGQYITFAVATVVGLLFNAQKILSFADSFRKRRIELLKEALRFETINENLKRHLEDEVEGEYFRLTHKVKMDKGIRDASINLYTKLERQLSFLHFIRARNHLELINGDLKVVISSFDKVGYYYNLIVGIAMLLTGFLFSTIINTMQDPTLFKVLVWIGFCLFFIAFGFFLLAQTFSIKSAKKVDQYIRQYVTRSVRETS